MAASQQGRGGSAIALVLRRRGSLVAVLRRHWLLALLLAAGLVLRVLAQIAYQPALIYVDSLKYLYGASPGSEPLGYTELLKVILVAGDLGTVTALQHLLGLAMAVALYAVLLRRGVWAWLAALAAAPVLLDAYQLQMEQMIMPDVWFEALILAGLVILAWQPEPALRYVVWAGIVLAVAAAVKQLGELLVVPAVIYLLAASGGWREGLRRSAALAMAFLLVIFCYCSLSYVRNGHFRIANSQPLTGRLVAAADCATLTLPANVRPLCPTPAEQQALGPDSLEHSFSLSPLFKVQVPPHTRGKLLAELKSAIEHQQPLRVAGSVLSDSLRLFALTRQPTPWVTPISRWQFQTGYPTYPPWTSICPSGHLSPQACLLEQHADAQQVAPLTDLLIRPDGTIVAGVQRVFGGKFVPVAVQPSYGGNAQVNRPIAQFLRSYQLGGGYTPGPLLALLGLAGLAGSFLGLTRRRRGPEADPAEVGPAETAAAEAKAAAEAGRADGAARTRRPGDPRTRQPALACLLFTVTAAVILFAPDLYEFSWRYELPAVVTLVPAGVLGVAALLPRRTLLRGNGHTQARENLLGAPGGRSDPGGDAPGEGSPERAPVV